MATEKHLRDITTPGYASIGAHARMTLQDAFVLLGKADQAIGEQAYVATGDAKKALLDASRDVVNLKNRLVDIKQMGVLWGDEGKH